MRIVMIRHLPTPGNEKHQYIGATDENLSEAAVRRFNAGDRYPAVQYVIASPMKRCIQTAELIYPGQKIRTEPLLRECGFGRYERKTYEELKNEPEYIRWLESGGMTAFPEGEKQEDFRRRCRDGFRKWIGLLIREQAESAAFVVHGGTIMSVMDRFSWEPHEFYDWQTENGGGFVMEILPWEWEKKERILRNIKKL